LKASHADKAAIQLMAKMGGPSHETAEERVADDMDCVNRIGM
jgi:hypothetical protein